MRAGVAMVRACRADLGIVLDTDVDRSAVVASSGEPVNSNRYIALMAHIVLRQGIGREGRGGGGGEMGDRGGRPRGHGCVCSRATPKAH